jgi:hypothetical protein
VLGRDKEGLGLLKSVNKRFRGIRQDDSVKETPSILRQP